MTAKWLFASSAISNVLATLEEVRPGNYFAGATLVLRSHKGLSPPDASAPWCTAAFQLFVKSKRQVWI